MYKYLHPKQIDIEVTSHCNLQCKLCPAWTGNAQVGHMDPALFYSIVDRAAAECPEVTIVPWLNGEPLMHPEYFNFIKYLDSKRLRSYITTNGSFWNQELFDHITSEETYVYQLIFSLDGLPSRRSKSIEIARPGSNRKKILDNIEEFIQLKRWKKSELDVCLKICRRGQDWEEIEEYIAYWLSHGADFVCVGDALERLNPDSMRMFPCQYSDNNFMVIKYDGRMVRCAYNDAATNDLNYTMARVEVGDNPLLDYYNNEAMREFRHAQRNGVYPPPCDSCGFAYTGYGLEGTIRFRNRELQLPFGERPIFWHRDYYNQFFSLKKKIKPDDYYRRPD